MRGDWGEGVEGATALCKSAPGLDGSVRVHVSSDCVCVREFVCVQVLLLFLCSLVFRLKYKYEFKDTE